jgi:hypothetical protein
MKTNIASHPSLCRITAHPLLLSLLQLSKQTKQSIAMKTKQNREKILPMLMRRAAFTVSFFLGMVGMSHAAVTEVSSFTDDGNFGVTSVTINGTVYSSLVGSTASLPGSPSTSTELAVAWRNGTTPALTPSDFNLAASGLDYRTAAPNIKVESTFQFGQTIAATDRIFLWDLGTGDDVTFQLIDSSGAAIGNYQISLTAANFGTSNLVGNKVYDFLRHDGTSPSPLTLTQRAVSFQLSDFTGTTGDINLATGIKLQTGDFQLDPVMVGLAAVPEPSTYAMLIAGLGCFLVRARIRAHRSAAGQS